MLFNFEKRCNAYIALVTKGTAFVYMLLFYILLHNAAEKRDFLNVLWSYGS